MRLVVLAIALLPATAIAQEAPAGRSHQLPACKAQTGMVGPQRQQGVRPQTLEQQPRAMQYYAVLKTDASGCQRIVMVRDSVGDKQR